jgi:histidinol phosphatase-like enzyme
MGLTLGVVSNWDCALPQHLERLGVADRFGVICASAAVGHRKPDPAIFAVALSALDVLPADALHVGDQHDEDVVGARAAGVHALLIDRAPGASPHDDVITALTQVPGRLAQLRAECAGVLIASLGPGAPPVPLATELLVECLQFSLFDDVLPTLDSLADMGLTLGVVSNWDCALPRHLERLGVADRFGVICASAAVGHRKPDPGIFAVALSALDVLPGEALHVGDQHDEDVVGAQAAGVHALLIDRAPGASPHGDVITALTQVPGRLVQ